MDSIRCYDKDSVREATLVFNKGKYAYKHKKDEGRPPFERCVEVPWVMDKVFQSGAKKGDKLFDFGCNKAEYIQQLKKKHSLVTYGIDAKSKGKNFVDHFFNGLFNDRWKAEIQQDGPYRISTAISAIEHAGNNMHPDSDAIDCYQKEICDFVIQISNYCFITVPFGLRPGWAEDNSRKNLYQFDCKMLDYIRSVASLTGRQYMEEVYKLDGEHWSAVCRDDAKQSRYRNGKSGASSVAMISVWKESNETD